MPREDGDKPTDPIAPIEQRVATEKTRARCKIHFTDYESIASFLLDLVALIKSRGERAEPNGDIAITITIE